jgi:hypothetical protein
MYINNTKGTHCCVSMATMVTRRRHNITFIVHISIFQTPLPAMNSHTNTARILPDVQLLCLCCCSTNEIYDKKNFRIGIETEGPTQQPYQTRRTKVHLRIRSSNTKSYNVHKYTTEPSDFSNRSLYIKIQKT